MTFLLISVALLIASIMIIRPALASGQTASLSISGLSGTAILITLAGLLLLDTLAGPIACLGLILAYLLHEAGRVLGHLLTGHHSLSFRLFRLPSPAQTSNAPPQSDLEAAFLALMGPAFGLAPMVLLFALGDLGLAPNAPAALAQVGPHLATLAYAIGAYNLIALLPIHPLDGGTLAHLTLRALLPTGWRISRLPAFIALVLLMAMGWKLSAPLLFLGAIAASLATLARPEVPKSRPKMGRPALITALAAYLALMCAYFLGGWWVIMLVLSGF